MFGLLFQSRLLLFNLRLGTFLHELERYLKLRLIIERRKNNKGIVYSLRAVPTFPPFHAQFVPENPFTVTAVDLIKTKNLLCKSLLAPLN